MTNAFARVRRTNDSGRRQENRMKARVTEDCIACHRCVDICPEVFEMGEGTAEVKGESIPSGAEDSARAAADDCPSEAIEIEEIDE